MNLSFFNFSLNVQNCSSHYCKTIFVVNEQNWDKKKERSEIKALSLSLLSIVRQLFYWPEQHCFTGHQLKLPVTGCNKLENSSNLRKVPHSRPLCLLSWAENKKSIQAHKTLIKALDRERARAGFTELK